MDNDFSFISDYFLSNEVSKKVECDEIAFSEGTIIENEFFDNHVQNNPVLKTLKNLESTIIKLSEKITELEHQQKTMIEFMANHHTQFLSLLDKYQK